MKHPHLNKLWFALLGLKVHLIFVFIFVLGVRLYVYTEGLKQENLELRAKVEMAKEILIDTLGEMPEEDLPLHSATVRVSSYNPVREQCDDTPLNNPDGKLVMPWQAAIAPKLAKKLNIKLGDKIILDGFGVFTVRDYTNARYKDRVDILSPSKTWSHKFGLRKAVMYY